MSTSKVTGATAPDDPCPELLPGTEFIPFVPPTVFLLGPQGGLLKLHREEAELAAALDGKTRLSSLLHAQLEQAGTSRFRLVFDLLAKLDKGGLLVPSRPADGVASGGEPPSGPNQPAKWSLQRPLISFSSQGTLWARGLGATLFSSPGLLLLGLLGVLGLTLWPQLPDRNLFQGFSVPPGASPSRLMPSYLAGAALLWTSFCLLLSLRDLAGACFLVSLGSRQRGAGLVFDRGLLLFRAPLEAVVRHGRGAVIRLHLGRTLLPFAVAALSLAAWFGWFSHPALLVFSLASLITGFFSLSPFAFSDFSQALFLLLPGQQDARQAATFLRRRFLVELFRLKGGRASDHLLAFSLVGMAWLYVFYSWFWSAAQTTLVDVLDNLHAFPLAGKPLAAALLLLLAAPLLLLLGFVLSIAFTNAGTAVRTPLRDLRRLAGRIGQRGIAAHAEVLRFLEGIPLFSRLSGEELEALCQRLSLERVGTNRDIVAQGERGDDFYVLVSGSAGVYLEDGSGNERLLDRLGTGDSFGEIALLENVPRTATVRALTPCVLFRLGRREFEAFVVAGAGGREDITDLIRTGKLLQSTEVFSFLTPRQAGALVGRLGERRLEPGETVFAQGDPGDLFYLIAEGEVRISRAEAGQTVFEKPLGRGDYFGEISLVRNVPRTAGASALTAARLLTLGKADFFAVLQSSLLAGVRLEGEMQKRLQTLGLEAVAACS